MAVEAGGIGARLRAGRERLGLTVLQVAERIHTDPRIVEAIEAENYEALGAPVYARGHIRHYADLVGESANELVQIYSNLAKVAQPDLTRIVKAPAGPDSNKLVAPALVVVVVFAVAGAIWWISALSKKKPQMSETHVVTDGAPAGAPEPSVPAGEPSIAAGDTEAPAVEPGATATQPRATATQPRAGGIAAQQRAGAATAAGSTGASGTSSSAARSNAGAGGSASGAGSAARAPSAGQTGRAATPSAAPTSSSSVAPSTRATPSSTSASGTTPTRSTASTTSAPATTPTRTASSAPPVAAATSTRATSSTQPPPAVAATRVGSSSPSAAVASTRAGSSAPPGSAGAPTRTASAASATPVAATPEAPTAPRPKNQSSVTLRYSADSWTEVYDASGARLFYDVGAANSVQTVVGTPPLRVVLGNASGVSVEYNGHSKPIAKLSRPDGSVQFSITRSGEVVRAKPVADGG